VNPSRPRRVAPADRWTRRFRRGHRASRTCPARLHQALQRPDGL